MRSKVNQPVSQSRATSRNKKGEAKHNFVSVSSGESNGRDGLLTSLEYAKYVSLSFKFRGVLDAFINLRLDMASVGFSEIEEGEDGGIDNFSLSLGLPEGLMKIVECLELVANLTTMALEEQIDEVRKTSDLRLNTFGHPIKWMAKTNKVLRDCSFFNVPYRAEMDLDTLKGVMLVYLSMTTVCERLGRMIDNVEWAKGRRPVLSFDGEENCNFVSSIRWLHLTMCQLSDRVYHVVCEYLPRPSGHKQVHKNFTVEYGTISEARRESSLYDRMF